MPADSEERYFGSVRFFKNMILLAVVILIALPTALAVSFHSQLVKEREKEPKQEENIDLGSYQPREENDPEPMAYQSLYPDFYSQEGIKNGVRSENVIYLTFDDGPSEITDDVLEVLAEKDVKATFFVTGKTGDENKQRLRDIVAQGHTLGMHTYSHDYRSIYGSVEDYLGDMYEIFKLIKEETGVTPSVFRFAGGSVNSYNSGIYQELIAEMMRRGFTPFDWNVSSEDAAGSGGRSAQEIRDNVVSQASRVDRGIVLLHDSASKATTAEALGPMIDGLRALGFTFDRLTPEVKTVMFGYTE